MSSKLVLRYDLPFSQIAKTLNAIMDFLPKSCYPASADGEVFLSGLTIRLPVPQLPNTRPPIRQHA